MEFIFIITQLFYKLLAVSSSVVHEKWNKKLYKKRVVITEPFKGMYGPN